MVEQMAQMAGANQELESTKINQQLELFKEQMDYQRQRDHRLQEHAKMTNINTKLAIQKQGEAESWYSVLQCYLQC